MTLRNSISRLADCSPVPHPDSWPARRPPSLAYDAVCAELWAKGRRTARAVIKSRARAYALCPRELDALGEDLSSLPPRHLVTAIAYIARNPTLYRWVGFGGEIPAINLRAAMLYARWSRRVANRAARRSA